jgi:hypothetical protein
VEQFNGGHFLAAFGHLDTITDQDQSAIDAQRIRKQSQHHLRPQRGHFIQPNAGSMKVIEQPVIEAFM